MLVFPYKMEEAFQFMYFLTRRRRHQAVKRLASRRKQAKNFFLQKASTRKFAFFNSPGSRLIHIPVPSFPEINMGEREEWSLVGACGK